MARMGHLPSCPVHLDRAIDVHYAYSEDGVRIAHQVVGDGDLDLLYVPGFVSNLELIWEDPTYCRLLDQLASFSRRGLGVRTGVHTGEVELRGDDVAGIAVTLANRIMGIAGASEIIVSRTVKDLVAGSGSGFTDRGSHALKGIPDEWQLYEVTA